MRSDIASDKRHRNKTRQMKAVTQDSSGISLQTALCKLLVGFVGRVKFTLQ